MPNLTGRASARLPETREAAIAALFNAEKVAAKGNDHDTRKALTAFFMADHDYRQAAGLAVEDGPTNLEEARAHYLGAPAASPPFPTGDVRQHRATLARGDSIVPHMSPTGNDHLAELGLGQFVGGLVTGRWPSGRIGAQMGLGTGGAGGYLVPAPLAGRVIDLARNQARVLQAGAEVVPMESNTLSIAKVATDPTSEWKAENAAATGSDMTLDRVLLTARTLMVGPVKVSVELAEDAANADQVIEDAISAAIALELDRAALYGDGSGAEPTGLKDIAGVTETPSADIPLSGYDPFSLSVQRLWADNEEPNAVIYGPAVAGLVDRLKDQVDQPLQPPASFRELRKLVTKQAAAGHAFTGDWRQLLIGMRTDLTIEASRFAGDDGGGAFRSLQVWIRGYIRADIQVARDSAFDIITNLEDLS